MDAASTIKESNTVQGSAKPAENSGFFIDIPPSVLADVNRGPKILTGRYGSNKGPQGD